MRKKIFLTIAFIVSLIPMVANQYGALRGVQEVSGLINLWNPIGMIAVILFIIGVWFPFKNPKIGKVVGLIGLIGIILAEIYTFLTWQEAWRVNGIDIAESFENAFPEFYLGLITSTLMIVIYLCILSTTANEPSRHVQSSTSSSTKSVNSAKSSNSSRFVKASKAARKATTKPTSKRAKK